MSSSSSRSSTPSTRLNPLDASWLYTDSRETPMHVGALLPFKLPAGAPKDFLRSLMHEFRHHQEFAPPWNRKLKSSSLKSLVHHWVEDDDIDLEYHVRHAALPYPGGERELGELVARLHSTAMDMERPLWECTLIEGLEGGRFAMFVKMHHSLIDGISGVRLLQRIMTPDAQKSLVAAPFWSTGLSAKTPERDRKTPTAANVAEAAFDSLKGQFSSVPELVVAFGKMLRAAGDPHDGLKVPFDAPKSILNGRVSNKRRFATQQVSLARFKALAEATGGSINDIVLAVCGGALRRFLLELGQLPDKPLTAGIPVSVRPKDDENTGNAITFIIATLGTDIEDAKDRLAAIRDSVKHAKAHVQSLPRQAMTQYTLLLMAPTVLSLLTGIGGRTRPMFNITISNVPGPEKPLYFRGAQLLGTYPASIVTHGQALNITVHSYAGEMAFGFTGCHKSLPKMQKIAVYTGEAFEELEALFLKKRRMAARTKRGAS
jgi:WS/DGAT/MGAT family acyltransferase